MVILSQRKILGVRVDNLSLSEVVEKIEGLIQKGGFHLVVTLNPEILMAARKDQEFLEIINQKTSIVTADGIGIIWAGKLLGQLLKERVTGNDLIEPLISLCVSHRWPVMLMGGRPGVAQKALVNLKKIYPQLLVAATSRPLKPVYSIKVDKVGPLQSVKEEKFLLQLIKQKKPAVVFVAMDFGKREKFLLQLIKVLKKKDFRRGMVFIGVGGALDYLAGTVKRAPRVFQILGLEWFWRLITQPRARLVRQLKSLPAFVFLSLKEGVEVRMKASGN